MSSFLKSIGDYEVKSHLGKGGYGSVYKALNAKNQKEYALKLSENKEILYKEYNILMDLQGNSESLQAYDYLEYPEEDVLVLELLGKNLSYSKSSKLLSFNCVCAAAIKLIEIIEKIHEAGIVHRDIKPSNFLITTDNKNLKICDYGFSSYYTIGNKHKEFKTRRKSKGTAEYASINNHLGFRQSRRDDIESLCYSLMYLINGELLWKDYGGYSGFNKWKNILNIKAKITETHWFRSFPTEIDMLLKYVKKLKYAETPNYLYLKTIFSKHVHMKNLYGYFDWYDIKKDTNIGNSLQIVEGATQITKLRREKKILNKRVKKKTKAANCSKNFKRSSIRDINKESLSSVIAKSYLDNSEKHEDCKTLLDKSNEVSAENFGKSEGKDYDENFSKKLFHTNDECLAEIKGAQNIKKFSSNNFLQLPTVDNYLMRRQNAIMSGELRETKTNIDIDCGDKINNQGDIAIGKANSAVRKLNLTIDKIPENTSKNLEQDSVRSPTTPKSSYPEFKNKLLALGKKQKLQNISINK